MVNVATAVATSAWFLASASDADALATVALVARAAEARLALEKEQGAGEPIMRAWRQWYGEALDSVVRLSIGAGTAIPAAVERAKVQVGVGAGQR
jgi:hypothetical protein